MSISRSLRPVAGGRGRQCAFLGRGLALSAAVKPRNAVGLWPIDTRS